MPVKDKETGKKKNYSSQDEQQQEEDDNGSVMTNDTNNTDNNNNMNLNSTPSQNTRRRSRRAAAIASQQKSAATASSSRRKRRPPSPSQEEEEADRKRARISANDNRVSVEENDDAEETKQLKTHPLPTNGDVSMREVTRDDDDDDDDTDDRKPASSKNNNGKTREKEEAKEEEKESTADVEMEEIEPVETPPKANADEETQPPTAVPNGTHHVSSVTFQETTVAVPRAPQVARLRMPSQHTPGKLHLRETAILHPPNNEDETTIAVPLRQPQALMESAADSSASLTESPVVQQQQQQQQHEAESPLVGLPLRVQQYVSDRLYDLFSPRRVERPIGEEDDDDEEGDIDGMRDMVAAWKRSSLWKRPMFWFFAALFLKVVFVGFWINPILHSVVMGSKSLTYVYKGILGVSTPERSLNDSIVEMQLDSLPDSADATTGANRTLIKEKQLIRQENLRIAKQNLVTERENSNRKEGNLKRAVEIERIMELNKATVENNRKVLTVRTSLNNSIRFMEGRSKALKAAQSKLVANVQRRLEEYKKLKKQVASVVPDSDEQNYDVAHKLASANSNLKSKVGIMQKTVDVFSAISQSGRLGDQRYAVNKARRLMGDSEDLLLDVFSAELWKPSNVAECPVMTDATVSTKEDEEDEEEDDSSALVKGLTYTVFDELLKAFKEEIEKDSERIMFDDEAIGEIKSIVAEEALDLSLEDLLANMPKVKARKSGDGPSLEDVQDLVAEKLEAVEADQAGRVDYASLHNGASILEDATSASFVDTLPILNRMAAMLNVQSYGFGPEAALTPTWPRNTLGQCWAFDGDASGSLERQRTGEMAVLTVQLVRPIFVENVSIEHPPHDIRDPNSSAIKEFKVIGYEDPTATGTRWHLGSFTYDAMDRRKPLLQEFAIPSKLLGQDLPKLASISLAIDSNWGKPVSCLYRFRVHGVEELSTE